MAGRLRCCRLCSSTRAAGDGDPAHHRRGWAADEGCAEDGRGGDGGRTQDWEGDGIGGAWSAGGSGLPGVWFGRLTRNAGCAFGVSCYWVPAPFGRLRAGLTPGWRMQGLAADCGGRHGSTKDSDPPTSASSGQAHHERVGVGGDGLRRDPSGAQGMTTAGGVGVVASSGGGSTRAGGYTGPAHHERGGRRRPV